MELAKRKTHRMTNYDPDEPTDEMMYHCQIWARKMLNPIIDWTEDEVWEFIHKHNIPYCKLYDEGYTRLGCIGCPMGSVEHRLEEFERYPKYKQAYIRAFDRMIEERNRGGGMKTTESLEKNSENHTSTAPSVKSVGGVSEAPDRNECGREVRVLDESRNVMRKGWGYEYEKGEKLFDFWHTAPSGMF